MTQNTIPEILAPAGNTDSFLAALTAGADAVYCGLKHFSARMEADNFSLKQLSSLTTLAHEQNCKVYIALNTLLKPDELSQAGRLIDNLNKFVSPDALIIQDLGLLNIAKSVGFRGELHFSTLANISFSQALSLMPELGISRVVVPRELNIDEIKSMARDCPDNVDLEVFIHGALCYAVSGRCYWSSYMGGKSGLRGRCVQPCRRIYNQGENKNRFFSCQDLSLDVLVRPLKEISKIKSWKIEGRKKGPHYVFYTVKAYQLFRDQGHDPQARKTALQYLEQALGREGSHYNFLPQRPQLPFSKDQSTGSGLLVGKTKGGKQAYFSPRQQLLPGDLLRIGYEDQPWHTIHKVRKNIPKAGRLDLNFKGRPAPKGTPVFLLDRREPELLNILQEQQKKLKQIQAPVIKESKFQWSGMQPKLIKPKKYVPLIPVRRKADNKKVEKEIGVWLSPQSKNSGRKVWHWLPPVIWPQEQEKWQQKINEVEGRSGANFVLNAPWQISLFSETKSKIWAGPFCNIANPAALLQLKAMGFQGAIISPELDKENILGLPAVSPLPLALILKGNWPLALARIINPECKQEVPFVSPKKEQAWAKAYGPLVWIFPNWQLDLERKHQELANAGYVKFFELQEQVPKYIKMKTRPGTWNWDLKLL